MKGISVTGVLGIKVVGNIYPRLYKLKSKQLLCFGLSVYWDKVKIN
jgi:hypothetical protein